MPYLAHADLTLPAVKVTGDDEDELRARLSILVGEGPPPIGSDDESEEQAAVCFPSGPSISTCASRREEAAPVSVCETALPPLAALSPRSKLWEELRVAKEDERRLRAAYEAEVARGADLRASLEVQEQQHSALLAWRAEQQCAEQELGRMTLLQNQRLLSLEDGLSRCHELLARQAWETETLSRQAAADQQESARLRAGGPVTNTDLEESLRAADREASELSQDVQRREKAIAELGADLQKVLEYMMKVNIKAAGGMGDHLTEEDFIPDGVRAHLSLGRYGEEHLDCLCRKYKLLANREAESELPSPSVVAQLEELPEGEEPFEPLVMAECQDKADLDTSALWLEPEGRVREAGAARRASDLMMTEAPTSSLEEEGKLLQEALSFELNRFTQVIAQDTGSIAHKGPAWDLLIAVTQGNLEVVKSLLPVQVTSRTKRRPVWQQAIEKLGWTAFHLAAVNGDCALIEVLKEDMVERFGHHSAISQATSGTRLPPLGVACLASHAEAARSLLLGMAAVDVWDVRGNGALHWAQMGGLEKEITPLLLAARADPEAYNRSGQRAKAKMPMQVSPVDQLENESDVHLIRAVALEPEGSTSFLSYTLSMLKTPVRDSLGFTKNSRAKNQAQLSVEEAAGVWSASVTNYTHAGLCHTLESSGVYADPANWMRSRQALVLTSERLLLFNASSWSLEHVLALSELAELVLSSYCSTVVVLRMHRVPDMVLDLPSSTRARFIDELQFATNAVNERWGGSDFSGGLQVRQECEAITALFDQNRTKVGLLAWLEENVFLFLPYVSTAVLLVGDLFFFGQLDLRQHIRGNEWGWRSYYFALKSGPVRKLVWCKRPTDELGAGVVLLKDVSNVQPLDTPSGEICLIIDYKANGRDELLTLRAVSPKSREDWILSIQTMQTPL